MAKKGAGKDAEVAAYEAELAKRLADLLVAEHRRREQQTRLLRLSEVAQRVGLSETTIWRLRRKGHFPEPLKITGSAIAWTEAQIEEWIQTRPRR